MKDTLWSEALLDLSNIKRIETEINFAQLKSIKKLDIKPGRLVREKRNLKHWLYYLSLPGYSKDSTRMCFQSSYYCGSLCAAIIVVFFEKENGKWVFKFEEIIMIS